MKKIQDSKILGYQTIEGKEVPVEPDIPANVIGEVDPMPEPLKNAKVVAPTVVPPREDVRTDTKLPKHL